MEAQMNKIVLVIWLIWEGKIRPSFSVFQIFLKSDPLRKEALYYA